MKNKLYLLLIVLLAVTGTQCSKEGPAGSQGPQGPQGAAGPAGVPGSKIYSNNGAPAAGLGTEGDYYLDKAGAQLYGPKTAAGWGASVALTGPAGTPGSRMHSGDGAPASGTGAAGDFYFDRLNATMYGPKAAGGWGTGVALRIARVISYVVTRASAMIWNASHIIDIGNSVVPIPLDIKENGIMLTYIVIRGTLTSDTWHPIPGHIFTAAPAVNYYFVNAAALTNALRISAYNEDGTDLPAGTNPPNPNKLRVVLIPADQVNNIARRASPPDLGNYEAVKAAFNIREEDAIEMR